MGGVEWGVVGWGGVFWGEVMWWVVGWYDWFGWVGGFSVAQWFVVGWLLGSAGVVIGWWRVVSLGVVGGGWPYVVCGVLWLMGFVVRGVGVGGEVGGGVVVGLWWGGGAWVMEECVRRGWVCEASTTTTTYSIPPKQGMGEVKCRQMLPCLQDKPGSKKTPFRGLPASLRVHKGDAQG
ncbi:hypothetical protein Tco_0123155 [Tanacetum coccineum]